MFIDQFAWVLVPANIILGLLAVFGLPFAFFTSKTKKAWIILGILYLAIILVMYSMRRAGLIADEQGIGGCDVGPLFCSDWLILLVLTSIAFGYESYLIFKYLKIKATK